jgi:hypothetical protein
MFSLSTSIVDYCSIFCWVHWHACIYFLFCTYIIVVIYFCYFEQDYELEQKMEFEMKMREGTTRLLAACKHQTQSLQAAKSLLTSNERMTAYIAELHRKSREPPQYVLMNYTLL